jgi:hypothetical protein
MSSTSACIFKTEARRNINITQAEECTRFFCNGSMIGTAKTEEQAITLIKSHVGKAIRRVEVY